MIFRHFVLFVLLVPTLLGQVQTQTINGWQMQDSAKVAAAAPIISTSAFQSQGW